MSKSAFTQAEFKITIEGFDWTSSPSSISADLQINLKIRNVGNKTGQCSDFEGIWLYSSDKEADKKISFKKRGTNLFNQIKPNDYLISYLTFTVPKNADNLELRFSSEFGGASKYITGSYDRYYSEMVINNISKVKSEADQLYSLGKYTEAIVKYLLCIKYDQAQKAFFEKHVADCYAKIGDSNYGKYFSISVEEYLKSAIDNYRLSLDYYRDTVVLQNISLCYEMLGNKYYEMKKYKEASAYYQKSLDYNYSESVKAKISLMDKLNLTSKSMYKSYSKENNSNRNKSVKPKPSDK